MRRNRKGKPNGLRPRAVQLRALMVPDTSTLNDPFLSIIFQKVSFCLRKLIALIDSKYLVVAKERKEERESRTILS